MRYIEFRDAIADRLRTQPEGLTWKELQGQLKLPYARPCPDWIARMEREVGLERRKKRGNALLWTLDGGG